MPEHDSCSYGSTVPVSVVVPTYERVGKLAISLRAILECNPRPGEIIVHIDGGDGATPEVLSKNFPSVRILTSLHRVGPGVARNRLVVASNYSVIVSFDDDSYPIDRDFFSEAFRLLNHYPYTAVLGAQITHEGEEVLPRSTCVTNVADFVGCGCAFRREAFLSTGGYVPVTVPYGMEESDLSLRLRDRGWSLLRSYNLRVYHSTTRAHHNSAVITSASVANLALLAFLRYPIWSWGIGAVQVSSRVVWLLRNGRTRGLLRGIFSIPRHLWCYRKYRSVVSPATLRDHLDLRRGRRRDDKEPSATSI